MKREEKCFFCELEETMRELYGDTSLVTDFLTRQALRLSPNPILKTLGTPVAAGKNALDDLLFEGYIQPIRRAGKGEIRVRKTARKLSRYNKMLSKELKKLNLEKRLQSGVLRKGWTQSKIMKEAHKRTRRIMKGR
tara:strand:- start:220 stop:627 length:408 start_codon:yes stop_codon:yes gene_type:complete